jgi:Trk K+ transport system NAD-binding subunit
MPLSLWWREWRASWRDTLILLREFRLPLFISVIAFGGGGLLYFALAQEAHAPIESVPEAIYIVLSQAFLQSAGEFPNQWYLQAFYFVMPLIGIGTLARGLTDFGVMLFNRRARGKEWEMAVASTFSQHVVLIGLGHLGFRVAQHLHSMHQDVVAIEMNPSETLVAEVRALNIPVIHDDGLRETTLLAAGVRQARAIMLCTQQDSLNLQMAVKARSLNPTIQVVLRIFDDDFAESLHKQFGFKAFSATGMAAPAFAAAAAGVDITYPLTIEGQPLSLARFNLVAHSALVGCTIAEIEERDDVSIVLLRHQGVPDLHPAHDRRLSAGDVIAVLGSPSRLNQMVAKNQ